MKTLNAFKLLTLAGLFFSQIALSQELIPATSEDQEVFDQQLEQAAQAQAKDAVPEAAKDRKSAFGSQVADEAKKLKDSTVEGRKAMGQLISKQKRKNQTQAPAGKGSSSDRDGRSSAPGLNNSGAPGQSGNHRKLK